MQSDKKGFTLIEILTVLVILGTIVAMALPALKNTVELSQNQINQAQMQHIKRAALLFYDDTGFVPDNVTLLIHPFQKCTLNATSYDDDNLSRTCKQMIAFLDSHYVTFSSETGYAEVRESSTEGDNGIGTERKAKLVALLEKKLDPDRGGWRGGYIGANGYLLPKNIKELGDGSNEDTNKYFFRDRDIEIYYNGFDGNKTLYEVDTDWDSTTADAKLYPIYAVDFNGSLGSLGYIGADALYGVAKYRNMLEGELTILDPWGTPYEIQLPPKSITGDRTRTHFARIVSFGKNGRRDTNVSTIDIDYNAQGYDDSVLYLFENNQTSFFFSEES